MNIFCMNYDEITHHLLVDFYEYLSKNPASIDTLYLPDSKLIISYPNEPQKFSTSNRFELLPKGDHKIFRWNGQKNGDQIIGHATGYVKIKIEDSENITYYQCNEMIIYMHAAQDKNSNFPYQILYHSIHLSNMDPPPQPEPKPESKAEQNTENQKEKTQSEEKKETDKIPQSDKPLQTAEPSKPSEPVPPATGTTKPVTDPKTTTANSKPSQTTTQQLPKSKGNEEKNPVLVENPNILIKSRTVLAYNLPFSVPQSSILPEFAIYGNISRYAIVKGRILIEFENPNSLSRALDDGNFYWNDRYIKIKQMEDQFN